MLRNPAFSSLGGPFADFHRLPPDDREPDHTSEIALMILIGILAVALVCIAARPSDLHCVKSHTENQRRVERLPNGEQMRVLEPKEACDLYAPKP